MRCHQLKRLVLNQGMTAILRRVNVKNTFPI